MSEHHHSLTPAELLSYMRAQPWAIEASVTPQGAPQAAVIGVAVTDRWELLFDTVTQSRKHQNLVKNPRVAFVIGWEHERTVQYEGIAELPPEAELPDVTGSVDTVATCGCCDPDEVQVRYSERCEARDVSCVICPAEEYVMSNA